MRFLYFFVVSCFATGVLAQEMEPVQLEENFKLSWSESDYLTLDDIAECQMRSFLFYEFGNYLDKRSIVLSNASDIEFLKDLHSAPIISAAFEILLDQIQPRVSEGVVSDVRSEANNKAEVERKDVSDIADVYLESKETFPEFASLSLAALEVKMGLLRAQSRKCSENLLSAAGIQQLTEPLNSDDAELAKKEGSIAPVESSNWVHEVDKSEMTDDKSVFLSVRSAEQVTSAHGLNEKATLMFRCSENTTSAFVYFGGAFMSDIQRYGEVDIRVDDQEMRTLSFDVSGNNEALGLFSGSEAIPFIKSLFGGKELKIRATPFNENEIVLSFDINGLQGAAGELRSACGW